MTNQEKREEKYRPIDRFDKLPQLPPEFTPLFFSKHGNCTYIFAISKDKNYSITWDGVSDYPQELTWKLAERDDLYAKERELL